MKLSSAILSVLSFGKGRFSQIDLPADPNPETRRQEILKQE